MTTTQLVDLARKLDLSCALALSLIDSQPGMACKNLAGLMQLTAGSATGLLNRLSRRHLINRTRSPEDNRVVELWATKAGRDAVATSASGFSQFAMDLGRLLRSMFCLGAESQALVIGFAGKHPTRFPEKFPERVT